METANSPVGFEKSSIYSKRPIMVFISLKLIPFILFFVEYEDEDNEISILFIFIIMFQLCDFFVNKNKLGMEMVGIKWYIDPTKTDIINFYYNPSPFAINEFKSNTFWIGNIADMIIWILLGLMYFFSLRLFMCLFCLTTQGFNFWCFVVGRRRSIKQSVQITREGLLEDNILFSKIVDDAVNSEDSGTDDQTDSENTQSESEKV